MAYVRGMDFKSMLSNASGIWVKVREINYLIDKGIMTVDREALKEYVDTPDPEYNAMIRRDSVEDDLTDFLGRELNDIDRQFYEAGKSLARGCSFEEAFGKK